MPLDPNPTMYGRIVRQVSSRHVIHYFPIRPHEFGFVSIECSPGSMVYQVFKVTQTSIYLRGFYSSGSYVDRRIDVRKFPIIYLLDPLPLVFYNDNN